MSELRGPYIQPPYLRQTYNADAGEARLLPGRGLQRTSGIAHKSSTAASRRCQAKVSPGHEPTSAIGHGDEPFLPDTTSQCSVEGYKV